MSYKAAAAKAVADAAGVGSSSGNNMFKLARFVKKVQQNFSI
jgi:hypothetical protein